MRHTRKKKTRMLSSKHLSERNRIKLFEWLKRKVDGLFICYILPFVAHLPHSPISQPFFWTYLIARSFTRFFIRLQQSHLHPHSTRFQSFVFSFALSPLLFVSFHLPIALNTMLDYVDKCLKQRFFVDISCHFMVV